MAEVARGPASVAVVPPGSTLPAEIEIDREKVSMGFVISGQLRLASDMMITTDRQRFLLCRCVLCSSECSHRYDTISLDSW